MQDWHFFCTFAAKMPIYMKKFLLSILFCLLLLPVRAQVYTTRAFLNNIRTLRVQTLDEKERKDRGELVQPMRPMLSLYQDGVAMVDGLDSGNTLDISFDEMSHEVHMYSYTLRHLNHDHSVSNLTSQEFVSGFTTGDISDIEHSLNTAQLYTHYRFAFPNPDMRITRSGSYALIIYEDGDIDNVVATVVFDVVEPMVKIDGHIRSNTDIELSGRFQQLDFDVNTSGLRLNSPNEISVVVRQNNRLDNAVCELYPTFIESNRLRYMNNKALIFEGGNEYRHFDTYSTYLAGTNVDRIAYDHTDYHAILMPDDILAGRQYIHEFDVNGQYLINAERTDYDDSEAEYMWVHWTLPMAQPMFDGALYVGGDLFENQMTNTNRMQYDADHHCYWLTALVKQGGVDYQYWFLKKGEKRATLQRTEGSFWQTQNEYRIYVYWRPIGERADRLVGVSAVR